MALSNTLSQLSGAVMAIVLAMIFAGLGVYILTEMGTQGNISILSNLSTDLGVWATTWFPIILLVVAASLIIVLLIKGFSGGR